MADANIPDKSGIGAGLKAALEVSPVAAPPGGAAAQLPLLPLSQIVTENEGVETGSPAGRGAGRPPGSRNRSTKEWQEFLLTRYPSPLVALAEVFSRPIDAIAQELGFTSDLRSASPEQRLEIFKLQLQCAKELAPYVHQKQPQAVDLGDKGLMQLIINTGTATAAEVENSGEMEINFIDVEPQQNQGLSESAAQNSVASDSVESAGSPANIDKNAIFAADEKSVKSGAGDDHQL